MNDEKKELKSGTGGDPNANAFPVDDDDNPWDDDHGGRTLAMDGPSFEMPSNIPSPISAPPPAFPHGDALPPSLSPIVDKEDEETRAFARIDPRAVAADRDPMTRHQDAHVVVGHGALGDDATLALAPGQFDLGLGRLPGGGDLGPPLQHMAPQPMYGGSGMHPAPQGYPPPQQGFDPMVPQPSHGVQVGHFSPSAQHPGMLGPPPSNPMGWAPQPNAAIAYGAGMPQHDGIMQPSAPPVGRFRVTPQLMLLVGAGVVCIAIFVIGIVLFVTTKF